jgi:hypothetical protein
MSGEAPCKICGTPIPHGQGKCPLCGTEFTRSEGGAIRAKVSVEKKAAEKLEIDISDPETRRILEDLTLLPGVNRRAALVLYKQGIRSASDFIKKAMPGEAMSERYAQVIANKLAIESARGTASAKEKMVPCPSCRSPNKATSRKCGVCGAQISSVKKNVDLEQIQGRVNETIKEVLGEFAESEDFGALPGDMKAEIAAVLSSEREISEEEAKDVAKTLTSLPDDMSQIVDDIALEDTEDGAAEQEGAKKSADDQNKLKKRQILLARLDRWRKMGYDVAELEPLVDGDFEAFKEKAKSILSKKAVKKLEQGKGAQAQAKPETKTAEQRKAPAAPQKPATETPAKPSTVAPKAHDATTDSKATAAKPDVRVATPEERTKFLKQIEIWKGRGFDIKGLAELLDTDLMEFKRRSMAMLKSQVKK